MRAQQKARFAMAECGPVEAHGLVDHLGAGRLQTRAGRQAKRLQRGRPGEKAFAGDPFGEQHVMGLQQKMHIARAPCAPIRDPGKADQGLGGDQHFVMAEEQLGQGGQQQDPVVGRKQQPPPVAQDALRDMDRGQPAQAADIAAPVQRRGIGP